MIDCTAWAPTREISIAFLDKIGIATLDKETGNIAPIADVVIHPASPKEDISVVDIPATFDEKGNTPDTLVEGFHFNWRFYGDSEKTLIGSLPQTDKEGKPLGLFLRTCILELVYFRTSEVPQWAATQLPVPPGYETPEGVRGFDPATIKSRTNVFS